MPVPLNAEQRQVMQAVYDHFRKNGTWPTLAAIARPLRRDHGIDAAGVIAEFPGTLMIPPRQGLRPVDADQIRLTLAGIGQCQGSADDDERFTRLIRWFAEIDLDYDPPSPEEKLQVTTTEAAAYLGIEEDHPALRRIRAMCGLDHLCVSTSGSDENGWHFRIDSDIWRFRQAQDLADLARIRQEWIDQGAAESARRQSGAAGLEDEALALYRDLGDRGGETEALNEAGSLHRVRGDLPAAGTYHRQALHLAREIGGSWDEAHALAGLGRCALALGRTADAEADLRQAQEIFQRIGAAETADVAAELDALTETRPAAER